MNASIEPGSGTFLVQRKRAGACSAVNEHRVATGVPNAVQAGNANAHGELTKTAPPSLRAPVSSPGSKPVVTPGCHACA